MRTILVVSIVLVLFFGLAAGTTTNVAAVCGGGPAPATGLHGASDGSGSALLDGCGGGGDPHGSDGNGYHGGPSNSTDPISGPVGTAVHISTMLSSTDTSCTVASSTPSLITASSCNIVVGNVKASFVVGNVPTGTYLVQISGSQYGDYITVTFTVQS